MSFTAIPGVDEYHEYYGPGYGLSVLSGDVEDENSFHYLNDIRARVCETLREADGAPSVQRKGAFTSFILVSGKEIVVHIFVCASETFFHVVLSGMARKLRANTYRATPENHVGDSIFRGDIISYYRSRLTSLNSNSQLSPLIG